MLYHNKICFICINHVYSKLKAKCLLISSNTIYTCKADFRKDTKRQDIAPWVTPFYYFVLALKLLSGDRSQILRDDSKVLLDTHQIPIDSQCKDENPVSRGKF